MACEAVDWILPDQDRDQWWALMNAVMNLGFHKRRMSRARPTEGCRTDKEKEEEEFIYKKTNSGALVPKRTIPT
jgi:hypothetical protein